MRKLHMRIPNTQPNVARCAVFSYRFPKLTDDWNRVTCKRCLTIRHGKEPK